MNFFVHVSLRSFTGHCIYILVAVAVAAVAVAAVAVAVVVVFVAGVVPAFAVEDSDVGETVVLVVYVVPPVADFVVAIAWLLELELLLL